MSSRPLFISLRWQIVVPVVGVLALTTLMFGRADYMDRQQQVEAEKRVEQQRQIELLAQLQLDRTAQTQLLASVLVNLPLLRQALEQQNGPALEKSFRPYWDELNLNGGVESVTFTGASHQILSAWGPHTAAVTDQKLEELSRRAEKQEKSVSWLGCRQLCLMYVTLPIVEHGRFAGALTLSVGLQDMVYRFRQMTDGELAVLSPHQVPGKPFMSMLGRYLVSVSGPPTIEQALTRLHSMGNGRYNTQVNRLDYDVYRVDALADSEADFLVLKDVTSRNKAVARADRSSIINALMVLGGAILLIFIALRPILERLRRGVAALALLGEGKYPEVREARRQARRSFHDEVGDVLQAASDAAGSLERLEVAKHVQTMLLQESEKTLKQERDFITTLLDTAPILVVTHDTDGDIRQINAQAVRLGGGDKEAIETQGFAAVFFTAEERVVLHDLLGGLKVGQEATCESHIISGRRKTEVLWFHTRADLSKNDFVYLSVGLDVSERRAAERRVSHLMDHDALTGLPNRKAFLRDLDTRLAQPDTYGVLLLCDLDQFKAINEIAGAAGGDALLLELVKKTVALSTRPVLSARVGNDEFALVFDAMAAPKAIEVVQEINARLVGIGPHLGLPKQSFSVCAGAVTLSGGNAISAADQMARAEAALSIARGKGQGQWHVFEQGNISSVDQESRLYWSDEIDDALQDRRLQHFYQPIFNIREGAISHWECLIRMRPKNGEGMIPPGKFMPIAESTGQVRLTDRWGLEEACRRLAQLVGVPGAHLSVNLSGRSLDDESTLAVLRNALRKYDIDGDRLILEITETHALADIQAAANLMKRFRDLGCKFSLDDFGVGYTSFRYLKELPVDYVKIDGSFISGLTRHKDDQVFVKTLTDAVHGFGKQVVAEFVEDRETLDLLTQFEVDYAQGYFIGKPEAEPSTIVPKAVTAV